MEMTRDEKQCSHANKWSWGQWWLQGMKARTATVSTTAIFKGGLLTDISKTFIILLSQRRKIQSETASLSHPMQKFWRIEKKKKKTHYRQNCNLYTHLWWVVCLYLFNIMNSQPPEYFSRTDFQYVYTTAWIKLLPGVHIYLCTDVHV